MPSSKRRNLKQLLRNQELSHNPPFTPLNNYEIHLVNKSTDINLLHDLIRLAQSTTYFTIDTESDLFTNCPALIQIEFIDQNVSTVILVETCHLPMNQQSLKFWLIGSIFKFILQPTKTIFSWGSPIDELKRFLVYGLYTEETMYEPNMVDVQDKFKTWHFEQVHFYETGHHPWGLQNAIYQMYKQFLDKSQRLNIWSQCLYRQSHNPKIQFMVQYAVNDCLSVTKLAVTIKQLSVSKTCLIINIIKY